MDRLAWYWNEFLIWAGLRVRTHSREGLPIIALDCGCEQASYARSNRTGRTACFQHYHAAIAEKGSRDF